MISHCPPSCRLLTASRYSSTHIDIATCAVTEITCLVHSITICSESFFLLPLPLPHGLPPHMHQQLVLILTRHTFVRDPCRRLSPGGTGSLW